MHAIRLRGPWTIELHSPGAASTLSLEVTAPVSLSKMIPQEFCGTVRCLRSFGCPTGLSESDEIHLAWGKWLWPIAAILNGQPLASVESNRSLLTVSLQSRNELSLAFNWPPSTPPILGDLQLLGDVRIEISPPERG